MEISERCSNSSSLFPFLSSKSIKVKTPFNFHPPSPNNNDALAPKIEIGFSFEILNSLDLKQLKLN